MPLADVLSAVRQLILDPIEIPADLESRRAEYGSRFPALRPEEIEDLAKMEPRRIRTYTDSIFSGQTTVLEDKFEITFQLIAERLKTAKGDKFYPFTFVREMHNKRPWRDVNTEGLGRNLVEYLRSDRPDIAEFAPEAAAVAEMELLSLQVIRAQDEALSARDTIPPGQLQALPVGALMELDLIVPAAVQFAVFDFDVPALRRFFYRNEKTLPDEPKERRTVYAAAGRDSEFYICWRELAPTVFEWLRSIKRSEPVTIEQLAGVVAESMPPGSEEVEVFRKFFELASDLSQAGIVILQRPA